MLLIDRQIYTNDFGGIPETMSKRHDRLTVNFEVKAYQVSDQDKDIAFRRRSLQAFGSPAYELTSAPFAAAFYSETRNQLVSDLNEHHVH